MKKEDMAFVLDSFEKVAIGAIRNALKEVGQRDDESSARAILSKIGSRIMFGKEVFDEVLMKQKP